MAPDPVRDDARWEIATRGLTPVAVTHLTRDALGTIDFAVLAPVKKLLKQFFSGEPWTAENDRSLADLVGPGDGWWHHELDDELGLDFGWRGGEFRIEVAPRDARDETFASPVVPEATPNPRTIRFVTPPIHDGPSRWYESADDADDPRVARLFTGFDDVANVLLGPTFVAVGIRHPDRWELLLDPMLRAITDEFASPAAASESFAATDAVRNDAPRPSPSESGRDRSALERAWKELGSLQPAVPGDLQRLLSAVTSTDGATRQVAARRLIDADAAAAEEAWSTLLDDPSRGVRRATVDAMVDAGRPALRPLLERAVADDDAWTRWKALRGLAELGVDASRSIIAPLADDPDFRVRLEASGALNRGSTS